MLFLRSRKAPTVPLGSMQVAICRWRIAGRSSGFLCERGRYADYTYILGFVHGSEISARTKTRAKQIYGHHNHHQCKFVDVHQP